MRKRLSYPLYKIIDLLKQEGYIKTSTPAAPLSNMRNSAGFSFHKKILTAISFSAKVIVTYMNNTCHASTDLGSVCAPRRVTYMGAW